VATTDPETPPDKGMWRLTTDLPAPGSAGASKEGAPAAAVTAEVAPLYGLRMWVEQGHEQTKHALGWSQSQVRSDLAMRRRRQLVCCAFSFSRRDQASPPAGPAPPDPAADPAADEAAGRGESAPPGRAADRARRGPRRCARRGRGRSRGSHRGAGGGLGRAGHRHPGCGN
jgi:hypothetical protein